ncbi:MAG: polysaccharide deacetylase family protein [Actinomycetota bacterium]
MSSSKEGRERAKEVRANELGVIPVLMYHRVFPGASGEYDLTPSAFRNELKRLWREDYVPVRTVDLVDGEMDVPAGKTPVVLTFDDSSVEQFGYKRKDKVDPDTAIGILLEFAESHQGFAPVASIYLNGRPFNASDYPKMLRDLHRRGFELGNHTLEHRDLASLSPAEVKRQLALGRKVITDVVKEADVATLSLPLGIAPKPARLAHSGRWRGIEYSHRGILLVGWKPAPSPFDRSFDPFGIPRIRSGPQRGGAPAYTSEYWLDHLKKNPRERYISDGDPATIAFPKELKSRLAREYLDRALRY